MVSLPRLFLFSSLLMLGLAACDGDSGRFNGGGADGGADGGAGGGGGGDSFEPGTDISGFSCTDFGGGAVTTETSGGGCELEALLGLITPVCAINDPENATDGDPDSFATVVIAGTGLDPVTGVGGFATNVSLTADVTPASIAAFEIEVPGFFLEASILESIIVETLLGGAETGESVDVGALLDAGGAVFGGRFLAGFVPTLPYDQLRIRFGGTLGADFDDHAFIFDVCNGATASPAG